MALQINSNNENEISNKIVPPVFKVPLYPAPRKKKVLDEETYVKKLENIIERDFFPDLDNLQDKLDYIQATEQNDTEVLRELFAKYSVGPTPKIPRVEDSPATFETPVTTVPKTATTPSLRRDHNDDITTTTENSHVDSFLKTSNSSGKALDSKLPSLDKFMATCTSEDNESFEQVMEEQNKKFMLKHSWLFDAESNHNTQHIPNLALPSLEEQKSLKILALTGTCDKAKDIRPCSVENWSYQTYNSVMYVPDGVPQSENQLLEKSQVKQREISYDNTRFNENPFNETLSHAALLEASAIQAYKKEGKVGIDGKELKDSPKVNGYCYVRTPSPAPGVDCSPFMTWGQVEGTPFQIDGSQTPLLKSKGLQGPTYSIPKISDRDELHLRLAEKVGQNHRESKSKAMSLAKSCLTSPAQRKNQSSRLDRISSMSPAAQKLFTSKLGVNKSVDRALRASYTPSPLTRSSLATPKSDKKLFESGHRTPLSIHSKSTKRPTTPANEAFDLTDNLLNLPTRSTSVTTTNLSSTDCKRLRAADFFN